MYSNPNGAPARPQRKLTAPDLSARKARSGARRISMVTAYDFTMARLVDEAGVDVVLVGDSLGMVVQGLANTLPVTLDEICYHGRAVSRALGHAHLVGDMPFMSYQASITQAIESAGKLVKEGGYESVKIEGGEEVAESVRRMVIAGIPVMGHVGLTPQSVHALGGFKVQGRGDVGAEKVLDDARALAQAGAYAVVLEAIPPDLAARVTAELDIPTIGIGAGPSCDGQVLVCSDLLGMNRGHSPKFAKRFAELGDAIVLAMKSYVGEVEAGTFPGPEHTYKANGGRVALGGERVDDQPPIELRH